MDITRNLSGSQGARRGRRVGARARNGSRADHQPWRKDALEPPNVTIRTEIDNITFKAPTVIPFVAKR